MSFQNKKRNGLFAEDSPGTLHRHLNFTASEQYRLLRTNLQFTIPEDVSCPVIGVTSSIRGEGKSTTAINLAYVMAEKGCKVLLIDGDLRIPTVAKKLRIQNAPGLTDMLLGAPLELDSLKSDIHPNLYILPAGEIPPNPSELIGSQRMENLLNKLKGSFAYIIMDLPPVNLVSDAMAISGRITGLVVVIKENYTAKRDVEHCFRQVELSGAKVLGCVMTDCKQGGGAYKHYGKYYKYRAYEADD